MLAELKCALLYAAQMWKKQLDVLIRNEMQIAHAWVMIRDLHFSYFPCSYYVFSVF